MLDYEAHQVNNVNIVNKILRAKKRQSSEGSSGEKHISLQAGIMGARNGSINSVNGSGNYNGDRWQPEDKDVRSSSRPSKQKTILRSSVRKISPERSRQQDAFLMKQESYGKKDVLRLDDETDKSKRMFRFEDLQTMKFNYNDFRPSDLIDLDSGDSDHEILAKFRRPNPRKNQMVYRNDEENMSPKFSHYKQ